VSVTGTTPSPGRERRAGGDSQQLHYGRRLPDLSHTPARHRRVPREPLGTGRTAVSERGLRGEFIHTGSIPPDDTCAVLPGADHFDGNPSWPRRMCGAGPLAFFLWHGDPAARRIRPGVYRQPRPQPERTRSFDAVWSRDSSTRLSLDATYFYNRFYDLMVTLGGSLSRLGRFQTDNLANSRPRARSSRPSCDRRDGSSSRVGTRA